MIDISMTLELLTRDNVQSPEIRKMFNTMLRDLNSLSESDLCILVKRYKTIYYNPKLPELFKCFIEQDIDYESVWNLGIKFRPSLIELHPNPTEIMQLMAVNHNCFLIENIDSPTDTVCFLFLQRLFRNRINIEITDHIKSPSEFVLNYYNNMIAISEIV